MNGSVDTEGLPSPNRTILNDTIATIAPAAAPTIGNGHLVGDDNSNVVVIGILLGIIVVLVCLFLALTLPPFARYMRQRRPVPQKTIDNRYDTIEGWLITKRARAHCDERCPHESTAEEKAPKEEEHGCDEQQQRQLKLATSYDTAETSDDSLNLDYDSASSNHNDDDGQEQECPICMEDFQVDDIVSWSPNANGNCNHAFHHHCIKEWLVRHGNCPFCRETFLAVDSPGFAGVTALKQLSRERRQREASTYFCVEYGLVTIGAANDENNSKNGSHKTKNSELLASNVTKELLATMRAQDDLESRASSTDSAHYRLELEGVVASTVVLARADSVDIVLDLDGLLGGGERIETAEIEEDVEFGENVGTEPDVEEETESADVSVETETGADVEIPRVEEDIETGTATNNAAAAFEGEAEETEADVNVETETAVDVETTTAEEDIDTGAATTTEAANFEPKDVESEAEIEADVKENTEWEADVETGAEDKEEAEAASDVETGKEASEVTRPQEDLETGATTNIESGAEQDMETGTAQDAETGVVENVEAKGEEVDSGTKIAAETGALKVIS